MFCCSYSFLDSIQLRCLMAVASEDMKVSHNHNTMAWTCLTKLFGVSLEMPLSFIWRSLFNNVVILFLLKIIGRGKVVIDNRGIPDPLVAGQL
uniref:Uncharacterized protein n=1 Tax=Arundo donax TaxID=35708 RepID=A0A0A9CFX1_ARUDO